MKVPIRVYTMSYVISGRFISSDAFLGWLNNPSKQTIDLTDAQIVALDPAAKLQSVSQSEVTVPKGQIVVIGLNTPEGSGLLSLPSRSELAVVYTARFVLQGYLHPTGEMPVSNLFNVVGGMFVPLTRAQLHALIPTREVSGDVARVMIVNKTFVDCYHPRG